jgi:hypothetical protein
MGLSFYWWHAKRWSRQCYSRHLHVLASWDLLCRWHILRPDRDVGGVSSNLSLWKICSVNSWCTLEFSAIWKCVDTMNLNVVKYVTIIWMYICEYYYVNMNPIRIWILYEFESYMNLNLKYSNIAVICIFQMVSASLS